MLHGLVFWKQTQRGIISPLHQRIQITGQTVQRALQNRAVKRGDQRGVASQLIKNVADFRAKYGNPVQADHFEHTLYAVQFCTHFV